MATVVLLAFPSFAAADVTAVEGQSFTQDVAGIAGCDLVSATIHWGDGTPTSPGNEDGDSVQGTHTYAEDGTYTGSLTYTCTRVGEDATVAFTATVQDASLGAVGQDVVGQAGHSLNSVVAHITDANPGGTADDFSAQIAWGDGSRSTGTVAAAAAGGFDVSGSHTYAAAGSYPVATTITDTGGATATASSRAQTSAAGQPPPPPPPPALPQPPPPPPPPAGPVAQFGKAPTLPCADDSVSFDASTSVGSEGPQHLKRSARRPITRYRWSVADPTSVLAGNPPVPPVVTTTPTFAHAFGPAYSTIGAYRGMLEVGSVFGLSYGDYPAYALRIFRPGVTVTLQVTDSAGETASASRYFTFRNPDETIEMAFEDTSYTYPTYTGVYYTPGHDANGNEVWSSDPNKNVKHTDTLPDYSHPIGSGVTDFTKPLGTVQAYGYGSGCHSGLPRAELTTVKLKPASLAAQLAYLKVYKTSTTIQLRRPCLSARLGCDGIIEVQTVRSRRRARDLVRFAKVGAVVLGLTRLIAPPGRRNGIVTIRLNPFGIALARAHQLARVTFRLLSAGSNGRIGVTSRTVRLLTQPRRRLGRG
ncbi:MAG: hypothetical protein ACR2NR_06580 [Solirubrobacteraceae bacterium]